jgi:uncharacterized protein (TIGR01244 family)
MLSIRKRILGTGAIVLAAALLGGLAGCATTTTAEQPKQPEKAADSGHKAITTEKLEPYTCGTVQRLHTMGGVFLASQPAEADFRQAREGGVKTVINLRKADEVKDFDEPALMKELGIEYVSLPFHAASEMTPQLLDQARAVLNDAGKKPILMHCNSGNRVGAVWLAHRVLDGGLTWDAALEEAKVVGMKLPAYEEAVKKYVESKRK